MHIISFELQRNNKSVSYYSSSVVATGFYFAMADGDVDVTISNDTNFTVS